MPTIPTYHQLIAELQQCKSILDVAQSCIASERDRATVCQRLDILQALLKQVQSPQSEKQTYRVTALPVKPVEIIVQLKNLNSLEQEIGQGYQILAVEEVPVDYSELAPHIQVEYDLAYWGGQYSQVGDYAYIPLGLVQTIGLESAFQVATGHDPAHIISVDSINNDEFYLQNGDNWFEAAQSWAADQAEQLTKERHPRVRVAIIQPELDRLHLELEYDENNIFSIYDTGTDDLQLVETLRERVQAELLEAKIQVIEAWSDLAEGVY